MGVLSLLSLAYILWSCIQCLFCLFKIIFWIDLKMKSLIMDDIKNLMKNHEQIWQRKKLTKTSYSMEEKERKNTTLVNNHGQIYIW